MVDTYYRLEGLEAALASGQLILTANSRLRNHLLRAQLQAQGAEVLRAPRVLTLQLGAQPASCRQWRSATLAVAANHSKFLTHLRPAATRAPGTGCRCRAARAGALAVGRSSHHPS